MPPTASPIIASLEGASKAYGARAVLAGFDFALEAGSVTALLGPNGAGKSTVAGLLTGRLRADSGTAHLFGLDPADSRARARMGIMLQAGGLPETLTVAEAVDLHAAYYARRLPTAGILEQAGLTMLANRRCDRLSGGEARKVQFALAIAGAPDLLVLDEPTTGFDPDARRAMWDVVRTKAEAGAGVLLATHHMDEAEALADRIVVIAGGRIIADGTPAAIKAEVAATIIRLRTRLPADRFRSLPGVVKVETVGADLALLTTTPRASLEAAFATDPAIADFTVTGASLEEALANLVQSARTPAMKEAA
jgi:ABC-2 type transport system ATP-binding protein